MASHVLEARTRTADGSHHKANCASHPTKALRLISIRVLRFTGTFQDTATPTVLSRAVLRSASLDNLTMWNMALTSELPVSYRPYTPLPALLPHILRVRSCWRHLIAQVRMFKHKIPCYPVHRSLNNTSQPSVMIHLFCFLPELISRHHQNLMVTTPTNANCCKDI